MQRLKDREFGKKEESALEKLQVLDQIKKLERQDESPLETLQVLDQIKELERRGMKIIKSDPFWFK